MKTCQYYKGTEPTRLNPFSLCVQMIEADRISTPLCSVSNGIFSVTEGKHGDNEVHDGVEVDAGGRVVAYHVCNGYPYSSMANWYYRKILEGKITIDDVPPKWQDKVRRMLESED